MAARTVRYGTVRFGTGHGSVKSAKLEHWNPSREEEGRRKKETWLHLSVSFLHVFGPDWNSHEVGPVPTLASGGDFQVTAVPSTIKAPLRLCGALHYIVCS